MASIGGTSFFKMEGPLPGAGLETRNQSRAGVDGVDVIALGQRPVPGTVRTHFPVTSQANLPIMKSLFDSWMGTFQIVGDDFGMYRTYLIKEVRHDGEHYGWRNMPEIPYYGECWMVYTLFMLQAV